MRNITKAFTVLLLFFLGVAVYLCKRKRTQEESQNNPTEACTFSNACYGKFSDEWPGAFQDGTGNPYCNVIEGAMALDDRKENLTFSNASYGQYHTVEPVNNQTGAIYDVPNNFADCPAAAVVGEQVKSATIKKVSPMPPRRDLPNYEGFRA